MTTATYRVLVGDALEQLRALPDGSVQTCITSPPYYGLRDYGTGTWEGGDPECAHEVSRWDGPKQTQGAQSGHAANRDKLDRAVCECGAVRIDRQIGLEPTPAEYVARLVAIFREVRRVLRDDGTLWMNLGDTMRSKSLLGIPWQTALALRDDGWLIRSEIIWDKTAVVLPESVTDRPHRAHETVFLLSAHDRYWYDADSIRQPLSAKTAARQWVNGRAYGNSESQDASSQVASGGFGATSRARQQIRQPDPRGRHKPDVWPISQSNRYAGHFATFPDALVEPMILAGCPAGGTVLDPFAGSGTTLAVANRLGRHAIGIELNPDYLPLIEKRCQQGSFVFAEVTP